MDFFESLGRLMASVFWIAIWAILITVFAGSFIAGVLRYAS